MMLNIIFGRLTFESPSIFIYKGTSAALEKSYSSSAHTEHEAWIDDGYARCSSDGLIDIQFSEY